MTGTGNKENMEPEKRPIPEELLCHECRVLLKNNRYMIVPTSATSAEALTAKQTALQQTPWERGGMWERILGFRIW